MIQSAGPVRYGMHDLLRGYARELAAAGWRTGPATGPDPGVRLLPLRRRDRDGHPVPRRTPSPARVPAPDSLHSRPGRRGRSAGLAGCRTGEPGGGHRAHGRESWPGHAVRLASTLFRYLDTGGHFAEAVTIHGHARHAARHLGDQSAEAGALHDLCSVDLRQGRYNQGTAGMRQALDLHKETGDLAGQARVLANLGIAELLQGRPQQAVGHFSESLDLHRETGDLAGQARALRNLGFAGLRQGHYTQAARHLGESLALCREIGDQGGEARALANLGEVALRQDRYQEAARHLYESLALLREVGDRTGEADALVSLGVINLRQGRFTQASEHLQQALALLREAGDLSRQAMALNSMGELLLATGHPAEARTRYSEALSLAARAGEKYEQARAHQGLGSSYQHSGDTPGRPPLAGGPHALHRTRRARGRAGARRTGCRRRPGLGHEPDLVVIAGGGEAQEPLPLGGDRVPLAAGTGPNSSTASVAAPRARAIRHIPATNPSTSTVPGKMPFLVFRRCRCSGLITRARSAWDRTRLSNSATRRTGAGVPGAGRGASGRSNNSLPRSSRNVRRPGRGRSTTSASRVSPDQACTSATVAGPKAPR